MSSSRASTSIPVATQVDQLAEAVKTALRRAVLTGESAQVDQYNLGHAYAELRCAAVAMSASQTEHTLLNAQLALAEAAGSLARSDHLATLAAAGPIAPPDSDLIDTVYTSEPAINEAEELVMLRDIFARFSQEEITPVADRVHRQNLDVPEEIISGLAEMGAFGLSIPEEYGGSATGAVTDLLAMLVVTEELSRASLGIGGSLITRPEIIARALLAGGTQLQKERWLPMLASGEAMGAVAVTEPDFGSDVAEIACTAVKVDGGWRISGTKTWCTFAGRADVLAVLVRTEPERSLRHRGLSLFLVEKPAFNGHSFAVDSNGGTLEGRAIDTLGYRGMHSYEVRFDSWFTPDDSLVGGESGQGRGFYIQMAGFESGRLQTVARANGLMRAAKDAGLAYARDRSVFGRRLTGFPLTRYKLARMQSTVAATRLWAEYCAKEVAKGTGALEASMAKAHACRSAEWVAREAMQIHGGMGYAEEYPVSRYFVDARVLSIFEGADETLTLKVIVPEVAKLA